MNTEKTTTELPSYEAIDAALQPVAAHLSPASLHGLMCGVICAHPGINTDACLTLIVGDESIASSMALHDCFNQLFSYTWGMMQAMDFSFQLVLPDDEAQLSLRTQALTEWCHGFITMVSLSEEEAKKSYSPDAQEALGTFQELANIDFESVDVTEEDEAAYFEIMEYVRLAVLMLFAECIEHKVKLSGGSEDDTVH